MSELNFLCAVRSVIGTRDEQQDYAIYKQTENSTIAVVCDGMGGLNGGSTASKLAAEIFVDTIEKKSSDEKIPQVLLRSVDIMDEQVFGLKSNRENRFHAGTTVVAVVIQNDELYWLSIGDSRLYIMRNDEFIQVTRDHNYEMILKTMPQDYVPSSEELDKKEALVSFVGMGGIEIMDLSNNPIKLMSGDKLLLTSDGLFKVLTDEQIKAVLNKELSAEETADELIEQSEKLFSESRDNTTVVFIDVKEKK